MTMGPVSTGDNRTDPVGDNTPGEHRWSGALAKLGQEIADLEASRALALTRKARRPINQRLHYLRGIAASFERMRV